jgi:hypothetical protein
LICSLSAGCDSGSPATPDLVVTDLFASGDGSSAGADSSSGGDAAHADLSPLADLPQGPFPDAAPPSPDAAPPAPDAAPPALLHLPHKTDFLGAGCKTHLYGGLSQTQRSGCRYAIKKRKYTHFYLYVYNEKDYGGPSFNYYAKPLAFRALLKELHAAGLMPVVWLVPDDAKTIHAKSTATLKAWMSNLIPNIDDLVSSYVLGLELDEYWPGSKVNALGLHLNTLTNKPIAVHQLKKQWGYAKLGWVDYMVLQYGFGESSSTIKQLTKQCMAALNKPVVAGEYALFDEKKGVPLGNAAVAVGASGFGNGGTP